MPGVSFCEDGVSCGADPLMMMSLPKKAAGYVLLVAWLALPSAQNTFASTNGPVGNRIDALVAAGLKAQKIPPSPPCSDDVFVRRVFLDAIGTLPQPAEVRAFLADQHPDKRARLIDALLARGEFADTWGLKWGDLLRIKSEFPCNLWPNAVQAYDRWVRDSIRDNKPYDQFVRELLTASGSNFRVPPVNFYRAFQERSPLQIADNVALVFMGLRLGESGFTTNQILGFSAFFAKVGYKSTDEWKEEIVFFNPDGRLPDPAHTNLSILPAHLDGKPVALAPDQDPRAALADWLTAPGNPWFARSIVNRTWFWLMGHGIVHEPDDMRPSNLPWSPELLAYLQQELVGSGFDLKRIYRLILNSDTYQRSSQPTGRNAKDDTGFSHYRLRRLDAEPLLDAINQILGGTEKYVSPIPEPFTFLPSDQRAITLADGSMESPFLELFGRPPRNTSYESERASGPTVFQAQHLLNSSHLEDKFERSWVLRQLVTGSAKPGAGGKRQAAEAVVKPDGPRWVEELYVRILSRYPTEAEKQTAVAYVEAPTRKPADAVCDLAWALVNTREFVLRH